MPKKSKKTRPVIIAGNWKMYKTIEEAAAFVKTLVPLIEGSKAKVYLSAPFTAIYPTAKLVEELKAPVVIGAQNMNDAREGAFTGEVAASMLKNAGARFVILGHSERRQIFGEDDTFINKKVRRALSEGLEPILCVGETLEERENGKAYEVLQKQIEGSLAEVSAEAMSSMILAYEPVWAIGTGKVAKEKDAEDAHHFLRELVQNRWGKEAAQGIKILYGGSVKPDNAANLLVEADVDGLLVGGASLAPESFSRIVNAFSG